MGRSQNILLGGSSLLAVIAGMSQPNVAFATTTTIPGSVTSAQTITGSGDTLSITSSGSITGVPTDVVVRGTGGTLINDGVLIGSGRAVGMTSGVTLDSVINTGSMTGTSAYGIANDGSLGSINNSGYIRGGIGGIATDGTIGTLTNTAPSALNTASTTFPAASVYRVFSARLPTAAPSPVPSMEFTISAPSAHSPTAAPSMAPPTPSKIPAPAPSA